MIDFHVDMGDTLEMQLKHAILCYQGPERSYLEIRPVLEAKEGGPVLGTGRPATEHLVRSMVYGAEDRTTRFHDPRLLASSPEKAVWYQRPVVRTLFFQPNSPTTKPLTGDFMQPALVFMVRQNNLWVRAVKGRGRPGPETPTYHAPYWNVYENGNLCHGTMPAPKGRPDERIDAWMDAFYDSAFTHPCWRKRIVDYRTGVPALWRRLAKAKRFPNERLLPAGQTLQQWIQQ